ncbi:hypothetical protein ACFQGX_13595 [Nonomuraea dietziae]|uniref:hypothetical protein n=1 Tax=Nonomuraea dietziae TaxID=65515 RepID=UPI00361483A3
MRRAAARDRGQAGGGGAAPPWLRDSVRAHLAACAMASADVAEAAAWLRRYAAVTLPGGRSARR